MIGAMIINYRQAVARSGHTKSALISALQKYIRRGEVEKAVYVALDLLEFGALWTPDLSRLLKSKADGQWPPALQTYMRQYPKEEVGKVVSQSQGYVTNLLNRLRVISVEDIGAACPLAGHVGRLLDAFESGGRKDKTLVVRAVYLMANVPRKTRALSDLKAVYGLPPQDLLPRDLLRALLDHYAIPAPTGHETIHSEGLDVFWWLSRELDGQPRKRKTLAKASDAKTRKAAPTANKPISKDHPVWNEMNRRLADRPDLRQEVAALHDLYKKSDMKESMLYVYEGLFLAVAKPPMCDLAELDARCQSEMAGLLRVYDTPIELDDYCYDKHVKHVKGRAAHETSFVNFATVGAVVNHDYPMLPPSFRQMYVHIKKAQDALQRGIRLDVPTLLALEVEKEKLKEKETCERPVETEPIRKRPETIDLTGDSNSEKEYAAFVVRAQINTGNSKADTYFAMKDGRLLFMKGPIKEEAARNAVAMNEWKRRSGLAFNPSLEVVELVPDLWPSVPLGSRNSVDPTKPAPFLVCESIVSEADVRANLVMNKGSVKWPPTEVVNWDNLVFHFDLKMRHLLGDYVLNLLARWIFGVPDLADRNFLVVGDRILAVDEEGRNPHFGFDKGVPKDLPVPSKKHLKECRRWLAAHYAEVHHTLSSWEVPPELAPKLAKLMTVEGCVSLFSRKSSTGTDLESNED
jgi:hypothetical protein